MLPCAGSPRAVHGVLFENHIEPIGIAEAAPRVSWQVDSPAGWRHGGYEVEVRRESARRSPGRRRATTLNTRLGRSSRLRLVRGQSFVCGFRVGIVPSLIGVGLSRSNEAWKQRIGWRFRSARPGRS